MGTKAAAEHRGVATGFTRLVGRWNVRAGTPLKPLDLPTVSWVEVSVAWYNGATRTVELTSQTAVWYRSGKPPVPLRWVLVRDPQGEFATQALLCTDLAVGEILEWFVLRWPGCSGAAAGVCPRLCGSYRWDEATSLNYGLAITCYGKSRLPCTTDL